MRAAAGALICIVKAPTLVRARTHAGAVNSASPHDGLHIDVRTAVGATSVDVTRTPHRSTGLRSRPTSAPYRAFVVTTLHPDPGSLFSPQGGLFGKVAPPRLLRRIGFGLLIGLAALVCLAGTGLVYQATAIRY